MVEETKKDPVWTALNEVFDEYRDRQIRILRYERQIAGLKTEAAKLQAKVVALARICEHEIVPSSFLGQFLTETAAAGITDGVRAVLQANGKWMTPTEIRTDLLRLGYDLSGYTNVMASIHTVLSRLRSSGEVRKGIRKPKRVPVYRWAAAVANDEKDASVVLVKETSIIDALKSSLTKDKEKSD